MRSAPPGEFLTQIDIRIRSLTVAIAAFAVVVTAILGFFNYQAEQRSQGDRRDAEERDRQREQFALKSQALRELSDAYGRFFATAQSQHAAYLDFIVAQATSSVLLELEIVASQNNAGEQVAFKTASAELLHASVNFRSAVLACSLAFGLEPPDPKFLPKADVLGVSIEIFARHMKMIQDAIRPGLAKGIKETQKTGKIGNPIDPMPMLKDVYPRIWTELTVQDEKVEAVFVPLFEKCWASLRKSGTSSTDSSINKASQQSPSPLPRRGNKK